MPQFWIAIFFILLAVAELYQSIKDIDLPLPIYLGLGTILAIASNYHHKPSFSLDRQLTLPDSQQVDPTLNGVSSNNSPDTF